MNSTFDEFKRNWLLVVVAMFGCGLGISSLPLYTSGVFFPYMTNDLGWTRSELSFAVLLSTLMLAVASPIAGLLMDRFGVARITACSLVMAAALFAVLGLHRFSLAQFYAIQLAIAALGAGAAPVAYTRLVVHQFEATKGLALGITLLGPSLVATFAPLLVATVISTHDWQAGYLTLAALTAAMLPLLGALLLVQPAALRASKSTAVAPDDSLFNATERRAIFSRLMLGLGCYSLAVGGMLVHLTPMLVDGGMTTVNAAKIAGLVGISGIAGRLLGGWSADRIFGPYILGTIAVVAATGYAALATFGIPAAPFSAIAVGFALGTEGDLLGYLVSRYFGKRSYGRVFGWIFGAFIACLGLSPMIMAFLHARSGSYSVPLWVDSVLLVVSAIVLVRLPKYRRSRHDMPGDENSPQGRPATYPEGPQKTNFFVR
ncbi:major facilitator transporter [Burkholderia arboris]|uniref:Major facilitator transporter n=1 Tax=Burkholderia arboris TaxID=488730 RepID=A0A9Q9UUM7_9BURK|nr:MFS transporter [Burkholderia arboris]VWC39638.1 major facilitator transporter [Burkholderia arboris]